MATAIGEAIENLWLEVRDLNLGTTIDHLPSPPSPLQFLRDYVSPNKPCLISNATHHWPSLSLWSSTSYLLNTLSSSSVSLHLTPTGRADSLATRPNPTASSSSSLCFASAHVEKVPFSTALSMVSQSIGSGDMGSKCIAYLQEQNDCFRNEYSALTQDCDPHIPWASEAFGCLPEAVNLWIGNDKSVTSFHKDHYENIYAVITGEKHFLLLPPTDVHRMYIREHPAARYHYSEDTGDFRLELEDPLRYVPWSSVNPYPSPEEKEREMAEFPWYFNGPKPFEITVRAGELLYLPSMWFHHVSQSPDNRGLTIAVNYCKKISKPPASLCTTAYLLNLFNVYIYVVSSKCCALHLAGYDMQFDIKYAYFNFLKSIPHTSPKDSVIHRRHVKSCSNESTSIKGELDTNESVQNGDAIVQSDCSEEE